MIVGICPEGWSLNSGSWFQCLSTAEDVGVQALLCLTFFLQVVGGFVCILVLYLMSNAVCELSRMCVPFWAWLFKIRYILPTFWIMKIFIFYWIWHWARSANAKQDLFLLDRFFNKITILKFGMYLILCRQLNCVCQ